MAAPTSAVLRVAMTQLRDALAGAGVPATLDAATVQVPGAWITPRTITDMTLGGSGTLVVHVFLIAQDVGTLQALDQLGGLFDAALTVCRPLTQEGDAVDLAQAIALPAAPANPLPAFRLTVELDYEG